MALTQEYPPEQRQFTEEDFLACLAYFGHEVRNPLSVLSQSVSLLRIMNPSPTQLRTIESMERQIRFVESLLDGLVWVGTQEPPSKSQDHTFDSIWAMSKEVSSSMFNQRSVNLSEELPQTPVILNVDQDWLVLVFGNLLANAAKFTPSGGSAWMRAEVNDGFLEVKVVDNGIGIPEEELAHVFEVFYRGSLATISEIHGKGLGLAIAKRLVEAHGGSITVASNGVHQGAEFTVRLPVQSVDGH